eukprot:c19160_g1_i1 orf=255-1088(+)
MSSGYPTAPSAPPAPSAWQQPGYGPPPAVSQYGTSSAPYGRVPSNVMPSAQGQPPTAQPYYAQGQWSQNVSAIPPSSVPPSGVYQPYGYPQHYGGQFAQTVKGHFPPGTDPEIIRAFQMVDRDGSGVVDASELQKALSTNHPFSMRTVRLMIHLYGPKGNEKIGPIEFVALWKALKDWRGIFERFDKDRSGSIDSHEMRDALLSLGYAISPLILQCLLQKYDRTGQARAMDYDSFVECGLIVKGLTERFKEKDTRLTGSATLSYEDFMLMVLPFIVA